MIPRHLEPRLVGRGGSAGVCGHGGEVAAARYVPLHIRAAFWQRFKFAA